MFELIKNLSGFIERIFGFFTKKNDLPKLKIGEICEIMVRNGNANFIGKRIHVDKSAHWARKNGTLYVCPQMESNPHIVISGMSGFGKSTLFKSILIDIRNAGISCILFDAHDEHSDIVRRMEGEVHNSLFSGINILELDGASVSERISELSRLFKEVYSLGYVQTTKLSECLWYVYRKAGARSRNDRSIPGSPTVKDLLDEINIFVRNSRGIGERNTLTHLKGRISLLNNAAFTGSFINTDSVNRGLHSFSLGSMKSKEARLIYIRELLSRLYARMHDSEKHHIVRLYIMIDEAQSLIENSNDNSVVSRLIEEGRKYGVGVIMVTHAANTLNRKIMANCATFATFYAREPSEINYVSRLLSGSDSSVSETIKVRIARLGKHQAIIVSNVFRSPTVVSTPRPRDIPLANNGKASELEILGILKTRARRPIKCNSLHDICAADNSLLEGLVSKGILDSFVFKNDLVNERWIMMHNNSISIEHEVMVAKIFELLDVRGMRSRIIDNSNGPDIVVESNGNKVAVEYETGSKSFASTSKMLERRLGKYRKTVIVANDSVYMDYVSRFSGTGIDIIPASDIDSIVSIIL